MEKSAESFSFYKIIFQKEKENKIMNLTFAPRGVLQIDDARIIFRNFEGRGDQFNREGDRNFALVIPTEEIADALVNDVNENGVGWNVKKREPRDPGDTPFMFLTVKVKFNDRGPAVYLKTGNNQVRLSEDSVDILDKIDITSVDLDIRPFDNVTNGKPYRTAYLQSICVTQDVDRFAARFESDVE